MGRSHWSRGGLLPLVSLLVLGVIAMAWFWTRGNKHWDLGAVTPPWDDRPSIYEHISQHIVPGKPGLTEGGEDLPDEEDDGGIRWSAGAMDGVMGHHMGPGQEKKRARKTEKALDAVLARATSESVAKLYDVLIEEGSLSYIDHLIEALAAKRTIDVGRLEALAAWLAKEAPDREPVKFAIAMLGIVPSNEHEEAILTLGRHDEFTLYSAVALSNTAAEPERSLFELAENVTGWGRIQIVERMTGTQDPEIKAWMLREGYKNSVMYEYLAYACATAGGLREALRAEQVDSELLLGAGDIIEALIAGGPAECMDDYADGAVVTERFVEHLGSRPDNLRHLLALESIKRFLEEDADWTERATRGWTPEVRKGLAERIASLMVLPHWHELAQRGLGSEDSFEFFNAERAARAIGIDTWDVHFQRLEAGSDDGWFYVMQTDEPARIDRVVALAVQRLPLDKIATGPGDELGMGKEWNPHRYLSFVLQELGRFPGKGWDLIRTGIRSPVVNNRHMALRALSEWGKEAWPEGGEELLTRALADEPDEHVRKGIETLLAGGKIEDPSIDIDDG